MKVLFVCTGNSCRSVMAHFLLNRMAADRELSGWEARSAGIAAERHFGVPDGVRNALKAKGIEDIEHVPQLATREILRWADLVLPMARMHRDYLLDQYPEFTSKTRLFLQHAGSGEKDVPDPIGKPDAGYVECRDLIEGALLKILEGGDSAKP